MLVGAAEVSSKTPVSAAVDSEYRFYAAWYALIGAALLRSSQGRSLDDVVVPAASIGLLTAAAGRLLSMRRYGRPNRSQLVLLGVELAIPCALVPLWRRQAAAA